MIRQILRTASRSLLLDKRPNTRHPIEQFYCQARPSSSGTSSTPAAVSQPALGNSRLPGRVTPSLSSLDRQFIRLKDDPTLLQFSPNQVLRRSSTFTNVEWGEYIHLCVVNSKKKSSQILMDFTQMKAVIEMRNNACNWLAKNIDAVKPSQYFNFLRYLQSVTVKRRIHRSEKDLPQFIDASPSVSQWFMKHYSTLKSLAFFEILKEKTRLMVQDQLLGEEAVDDILKVLGHGVKLAQKDDCEINSILHLLYTIELYSHIFKNEVSLPTFAEQLIEVLKKKEMPSNGKDLLEAMIFLSENKSLGDLPLTNRAVFRRYAKENYAAWKWLRNAIQLIFETNEYAPLRQMAAAAAVRAYKWKAVDFTPDEIDSFLRMAAEPFFTNPTATYFDSPIEEELSLSSANRLKALIVTIRNAADSDLPRLGKLSIRLDDAFWDRFFDAADKNAPDVEKRVGELMSLARIVETVIPKSTEKSLFIAPLFNKERKERLRNIMNQGFAKGSPNRFA